MKHKPGFNKNAFLSLIRHLRNKLNANQPYFFFREIITQFIKCVIYLVSSRFLEIIIDIQHVVFVHNLIQEVINIQLCTRINDCLDFVQSISKLNTFGKCDIIQCHLTVYSLNNSHFHLGFISNRTNT